MRVMCINQGFWTERKRILFVFYKTVYSCGPKYGDECTVVGHTNPGYYDLAEWDDGSYCQTGFIPMSGEKEEIEEEKIKTNELTQYK